MKSSGSKPSWTDVKTKLADFDRTGLLGLVHDLYMASKDNQAFLHARFALAGDRCAQATHHAARPVTIHRNQRSR